MYIEDLESNKLNLLFLKELLKYEFKSDSEYNKIYKEIRKKFKICQSKPILRKLDFIGGDINKNVTFKNDKKLVIYKKPKPIYKYYLCGSHIYI